ncbi:replication initiation protein, partial [Candidatus Poribacteria bacterium]|nr:replication initiation protein [Candidatus Poribacteria bacterium]
MTNYNKNHPALSRFFENLPNYPRCTDNLKAGCRKCPKHIAIKRRYIELNKENYSVTYLPYDCDSPIGMLMWHIRSLPPPTLSVSNWDNFRSHLTWELSMPV